MAKIIDIAGSLPQFNPAPPPPSTAPAPVVNPPVAINQPAHPATPTPTALGGGLPAFNTDPNAYPQAAAPSPHDPNVSPLTNLLFPGGHGASNHMTSQPFQPASAVQRVGNFILGDDAGTAKLNEQDSNAAILNDPRVLAYRKANPGVDSMIAGDQTHFATAIQAALAGAKSAQDAGLHTYTTPTGPMQKQAQNPGHVDAQSQLTGEHPKNVLPFVEPHQFTEDEFVHATRGMTWKQAGKLFAMQHYLTPQQQVVPMYANYLQTGIQKAKADYDAAVAAGKPPAELATHQKAFNDLSAEYKDWLKKGAEGQLSLVNPYLQQQ